MDRFAELVINIEAPLEGTYHYHIPADLRDRLEAGHLVEVEFGRRMAQGVVIALSEKASVDETKPIISIIDARPVVTSWQIELARWLSHTYLTSLNACIRLLLPPGITRWADITVDIAPGWDGSGLHTDAQRIVVGHLQQKGFQRGRQLKRALRGVAWKAAVNQLVRRGILIRGTILEAPRLRPRRVRMAQLVASPSKIRAAASELGRKNRKADIVAFLLQLDDPLPPLRTVLAACGASLALLAELERAGIVRRVPGERLLVATEHDPNSWPSDFQEQLAQLPTPVQVVPAEEAARLTRKGLAEVDVQEEAVALAVKPKEALHHIFRLRNATTYERVLELLASEAQPVSLEEIYSRTPANISHLRRLAAHDLIRLTSAEVWRDSLADRDFVPASPPELTPDQAKVWGQIKMKMMDTVDSDLDDTHPPQHGSNGIQRVMHAPGAPLPILLHGVTGSGKTEIYMRAIDFTLRAGKRAIVLVPEIALTPQTVRRFAARFPGQVAVVHSGLSEGERFDTWRRARQGLIDIVIGPRSALFTPLDNLGVIVLDEEHDNSYKQTPPIPPPYYHARDTAIALGELVGATVILGSATPDIVSYHRARSNLLQLLELPKRVMGHRRRVADQSDRLNISSRFIQAEDAQDAVTIPLPPVRIVDMRQELRSGNRSIFSRPLQIALDEVLSKNEQAILFLNRRGTSSFVICRSCGLLLLCPRCDVPLTYHRPHMALICHHCGRREPNSDTCPQCGSRRIKHFGLGTEGLQAELRKVWPEARIVRWDSDTTRGKDQHEILLSSFIRHEADFLVGTQMIAKGLDLPLVTLVGVVSADVSLGLPDYRTGERTFQLLAQVAGRAGRGLLGGHVLIQTYQPEHYAIQTAADHDFVGFYLEEMRFRTRLGLPPFRRIAKLILVDPVSQRAEAQAKDLARALRQHARDHALAATDIIGPAPPFFSRVDGRYRWQIIVRTPEPRRLLADFHIPRNWVVDIDPVSIL